MVASEGPTLDWGTKRLAGSVLMWNVKHPLHKGADKGEGSQRSIKEHYHFFSVRAKDLSSPDWRNKTFAMEYFLGSSMLFTCIGTPWIKRASGLPQTGNPPDPIPQNLGSNSQAKWANMKQDRTLDNETEGPDELVGLPEVLLWQYHILQSQFGAMKITRMLSLSICWGRNLEDGV